MMRIGVDVGGTHTDAVVLAGTQVVASHKALTSSDITSGIIEAVSSVVTAGNVERSNLEAVMVGTTQFTNAVIERRFLEPVAAIRLGLPATASVPPLYAWPEDLHAALGDHVFLMHGGHHYDGSDLSAVREEELLEVAGEIRSRGLTTAAVTCVFAPVNTSEQWCAQKLRAHLPDLDITLSSDLGRVGLLERENATLLNASLRGFARRVVGAFEAALAELEIDAPFFLSQNDGTLMQSSHAIRFPVLTFASGPTNSMRGASFLCRVDNAIVVDVGGTTADIGMLIEGFPRESSVAVDVGGVLTNFRMPDVLSFGLGGGTRIDGEHIGPESVGHELITRGLVFGGDVLTATDVAVASGRVRIGDPERVAGLDSAAVAAWMQAMAEIVATGIDRIKTAATPLPVIAVGGGQFLVPDALEGAATVLRPEHAGVANAIGAALAKVSGEAEIIYARGAMSRDAALDAVTADARAKALAAGVVPATLAIADIEETAMAYMAEGTDRIRVKVVGDLDLQGIRT